MADLPTGTVTFLFTDIEGSTRLWQQSSAAMQVAVARHDGLLRTAIEGHGGVVFSTSGDGVAAAFQAASSGVAGALEAQRRIHQEEWPNETPIRVRMGIHTGEAQQRDGNYFGTTLNRTARLMEVGHGGQVLCSATTVSLLEAEAPLIDLGEHRLRDLDRPIRVFQLGEGAFPALRSLDAFPGNLPLQVSSFIGRDRELTRVTKALEDARVVTLTGVGGVGKTRLALQVAAEVLPRFREGAWMVELAAVRDPDGVLGAVAAVFGVSPRGGHSLQESLTEFLRTKQLLLVLDNCEHLLEAVADLVEALQRSCAGLVVLATSREGLSLEGEQNLTVPSLAAPGAMADLEEIAQSDAVALFVQRAQRTDADFALSTENAASVVRVCRRLDGVPLAIELAAAQISAMTPAELATGLNRRFETLSGGRRRAVQRHQTLRAAIDWSFELCSVPEQRLLARLAVFSGGCTRESAEAICSGDPVNAAALFSLLRPALVAKSLVVAERDHPETRYRLLETIREYGEERLAEHEETETLRARHAECFADFARQVSNEMFGPQQIDAAKRFGVEHENLLAAMNHAIDSDDADLALRIVRNTPPYGAQIGFLLSLPVDAVFGLTDAPEHPLYPYALASAAWDAGARGDLVAAEDLVNRAVAATDRRSDPDHFADQMISSAHSAIAVAKGAHGDSARHLEHAAAIAKSADRLGWAAYGLGAAAFEYVLAGDADAAKRLARDGLALARHSGMPSAIVSNLNALAGALVDEDPDRAKALFKESLQLRGSLGYQAALEMTQATILGARLELWPETLELADSAIRLQHWAGNWTVLGGIFNLVARALVPFNADGAAVLQGAARRFATGTSSLVPRAGQGPKGSTTFADRPAPAGLAGLITETRRATTGLLVDNLGDLRLHELRAQGEAMDNDHATAFALDAIAKTLTVTSCHE